MELQKIQTVANKISGSMINGIRTNLQEFDSEINMFDMAVAMLMACTSVLNIMYECTMVQALKAMQDATKSIRINNQNK